MSNSTPAASSSQPPSKAAQIRLLVMLGLFALVVIVGIWDYLIAQPGVKAANANLQKFVDEVMRQGVKKEAGAAPTVITQEVVHEKLGRKPSSVKDEPTHTIETFWYGGMPHRNFLLVIYEGPEGKRRYSSHLHDTYPEASDLPMSEAEKKRALEAAQNAPPQTTQEGGGQTPAPPGPSDAPTPPPGPPGETKPAAPAEKPAGEPGSEK